MAFHLNKVKWSAGSEVKFVSKLPWGHKWAWVVVRALERKAESERKGQGVKAQEHARLRCPRHLGWRYTYTAYDYDQQGARHETVKIKTKVILPPPAPPPPRTSKCKNLNKSGCEGVLIHSEYSHHLWLGSTRAQARTMQCFFVPIMSRKSRNLKKLWICYVSRATSEFPHHSIYFHRMVKPLHDWKRSTDCPVTVLELVVKPCSHITFFSPFFLPFENGLNVFLWRYSHVTLKDQRCQS